MAGQRAAAGAIDKGWILDIGIAVTDLFDGDPNEGGSSRRSIMTAYRQDALQCAAHLGGPRKAAVVAGATRVDRARAIMRADHCGGFERARSQGPFTSVRPDGRLEDSRD